MEMKSIQEVKLDDQKSEDRLRDLPDDILHHILSSLEMKLVVRTSVISRRWRDLWLNVPHLNFNLSIFDCKNESSLTERVNSFMDFVDRVLTLHTSNFQNLNVVSGNVELESSRVFTWIVTALSRQVQNLGFEVTLRKPLQLPYHIFTSNVRVLSLKFYRKWETLLPLSISSSRIVHLNLRKVRFPKEGDGELNLRCPVLKRLKLSYCDCSNIKALVVSAPDLEILKCCSLYTDLNCSCKVKLGAVLLKHLKITTFISPTYPTVDYRIEDLPSLVSATIDVRPSLPGVDGEESSKACAAFLYSLLTGIPCIPSLILSEYDMKLLTGFPELLKKHPDVSANVKDMEIRTGNYCLTEGLRSRTSYVPFLDEQERFETSASQLIQAGRKESSSISNQSREDAQKILEQLERFVPFSKEKSCELMATGVMDAPSSLLVSGDDHCGSLCVSSSQKQPRICENGARGVSIAENNLGPKANGIATITNKDTIYLKNTNTVVSCYVEDGPQKKPPFETYANKDCGNCNGDMTTREFVGSFSDSRNPGNFVLKKICGAEASDDYPASEESREGIYPVTNATGTVVAPALSMSPSSFSGTSSSNELTGSKFRFASKTLDKAASCAEARSETKPNTMSSKNNNVEIRGYRCCRIYDNGVQQCVNCTCNLSRGLGR